MKTFKGILYGIAIAIAVSAGAATVYNYFPPPGMTYSPTTGFVVGSATGGAQGAGTVNAQGMFINGSAVATGGSVPSSANPTASVGLTAINGSGTAYMLANAAPALSQAIIPTWTGAHTFSPASGIGITINAVAGSKAFRATGAAGDYAGAFTNVNTAGSSFGLLVQAGTNSSDFSLRIQNTGAGSDYVRVFGDGGLVTGNPTGGDQGVGTINMQGCFVNGVACSTGGAAGGNPTGTVGLTAVNGVAGTYMRSDAAPPLSQAISPTWTGTHLFTGAVTSSGATTGVSMGLRSSLAALHFDNSSGATDAKRWEMVAIDATHLSFRTLNDATTTADEYLSVTRSGVAVTALSFGNATDNPTYTFLGTGLVTLQKGFVSAPAGSAALMDFAGNGNTYQVTSFSVGQSSGGIAQLVQRANLDMQFWTNATTRMVLSAAGGLAINAPSSGTTLGVTGVSNGNTAVFSAGATSGQSFGVVIQAGTTSADYALNVQNQATNTTFLKIFGDGGIATGSLTSQGAGTINASQLYQSGNPIYREVSWAGTCTAGGCTTGISKGTGTVTRNSAGNYTVAISSAFGGNAGCTASPWSSLNNGAISAEVSTANTTSVSVVVLNTSGTAVDSGFTVVCIG